MTSDSDDAFLEAGRLLFAGEWGFVWASSRIDNLPPMTGVEFAFAGRSNVGKSSMINALTGRKALARTSHTPGRTQQLNFFRRDERSMLVDMPGYGFAAVGKQKVAEWTELIHAYLRGRQNLGRVYLLVDARHGLKEVDADIMSTLDKAAVSYQIVLTKADEVKPDALAEVRQRTEAAIKRRAAAFPNVVTTSSETGEGIPELRAGIARMIAERAR